MLRYIPIIKRCSMLNQSNHYRNKDRYIILDDIKYKQKLDNKTFDSREKYDFML